MPPQGWVAFGPAGWQQAGGNQGWDAERLATVRQSSRAYCRHLCQSRKPRWRVRCGEVRWSRQIAPTSVWFIPISSGCLPSWFVSTSPWGWECHDSMGFWGTRRVMREGEIRVKSGQWRKKMKCLYFWRQGWFYNCFVSEGSHDKNYFCGALLPPSGPLCHMKDSFEPYFHMQSYIPLCQ